MLSVYMQYTTLHGGLMEFVYVCVSLLNVLKSEPILSV